MCGFVVGRLLQAVVGCWDGFNDPWVWWIGIASVAVVRSGVFMVSWCLILWVFIWIL